MYMYFYFYITYLNYIILTFFNCYKIKAICQDAVCSKFEVDITKLQLQTYKLLQKLM